MSLPPVLEARSVRELAPPVGDGDVVVNERLGGLLNSYLRAGA